MLGMPIIAVPPRILIQLSLYAIKYMEISIPSE